MFVLSVRVRWRLKNRQMSVFPSFGFTFDQCQVVSGSVAAALITITSSVKLLFMQQFKDLTK